MYKMGHGFMWMLMLQWMEKRSFTHWIAYLEKKDHTWQTKGGDACPSLLVKGVDWGGMEYGHFEGIGKL